MNNLEAMCPVPYPHLYHCRYGQSLDRKGRQLVLSKFGGVFGPVFFLSKLSQKYGQTLYLFNHYGEKHTEYNI